jgi:hypothetical protein
VRGKRLPWVHKKQNIVDGFLPWARWIDCYSIEVPGAGNGHAHEYAGVYLFAQSARRPRNPVDFLDPRIMYVGESGSLRRRFAQYARWVTREWRWKEHRTWISVFPIWFAEDDPNVQLQLRLYTERRILWERANLGLTTLNLR